MSLTACRIIYTRNIEVLMLSQDLSHSRACRHAAKAIRCEFCMWHFWEHGDWIENGRYMHVDFFLA